jgi:hypothetical protein
LGLRRLEKMKWFLDSEPIQGVLESYTGRRWKALEYRRLVEEGLIGEIEDRFEPLLLLPAQPISQPSQPSV